MLGSVTERVLRQAPCPVLVVRETKPFQHVLITLDGSELSEQALEPGLEVARCFGSRVTLFQVEPSVEIAPQFVAELESVEGGLSDKARDDFYLETYLQRVSQRFQPTMDQEIEFASARGPVAPAILDFIESHDVDLLAMTTHGRSGLKRWVYGSVTEKVLRVADCGLLVVRPPAE
jgi:nucleotide-binding universal stress UspA family protein